MDRDLTSTVAHRWHPIAAPLSDSSVRLVLERAAVRPRDRVLDLGCGSGGWILSLLAAYPQARAVGVDRSATALQVARKAAADHHVGDRAEWVEADAAAWHDGRFDLVLSVGASHAFGGTERTLGAMRRHLAAGGRAILGDTVWERSPGAAAQTALDATPDDFPDVAGLVALAQKNGFEPSYGHISTLAEWDEYEWCWTGALTQWALSRQAGPDQRREILDTAREHRRRWLDGYRGALGFVTLVLHDVAGEQVAGEQVAEEQVAAE